MLDFKNFSWRSLQKYLGPNSAKDLNSFLENIPQHVGQTALIAAGISWGMGAALGLFTMVQVQQLTEIRAEFREAEALTPVVPKIKHGSISKDNIAKFLEKNEDFYEGLAFRQQGSTILITATSTARFAEFREALGHIQNGGTEWRISLDKLCVGRECAKQHKLAAALKINKVSVEKPGS